MRTLRIRTLIALLATATAARPQQQPPPQDASATPTLSIRVQLVSVTALVRDKKGELIHGLTKDDFELREDGKPRPIRYFNTDSDLPLTLGLLVDTSGSMLSHTADEQQASADFLEDMLTRPQDRAFLVRFDRSVMLLQGTTSDVWQLKSALWMLDDTDARPTDFHAHRGDRSPGTNSPSSPPQSPAQNQRPDHGFYNHGGTLLLDGIIAASQKVIGKEPGRRALVVLTDGDDNGSRSTLDDTIHAAQNADVAVYSILYLRDEGGGDFGHGRGRGGPGMGGGSGMSGKEVMEHISQRTGGRCFIVSKRLPMAHIFALIEQDMRSQYRIGFTPLSAEPAPPPPPAPPSRSSRKSKKPVQPAATATPPSIPDALAPPAGRYHTLELKTRDSHQTVQARSGYFAPSDTPATAQPTANPPSAPNTSTTP